MYQLKNWFDQFLRFLGWRFKKVTLLDLKEHIDEIVKEKTFINYNAGIRKELYLIIEQSSVADTVNEFWPFLHTAMAHELIIRISRLVDMQFSEPDKRVYSLMALLMDIRRAPELLSRRHYVGGVTLEERIKNRNIQKDKAVMEEYNFARLNKEYDDLIGSKNGCISKKEIDKDIKIIRKTIKNLKQYRNQTLAHNAVVKTNNKLKLTKIIDAIDVLNKLVSKYYTLIQVGSHSLSLPIPDFTDLFLKPWVKNGEGQKKITCDLDDWMQNRREEVN